MNFVELAATVVIGKILTDLLGGKKGEPAPAPGPARPLPGDVPTRPGPPPAKPAPPPPTSPPAAKKPLPPQNEVPWPSSATSTAPKHPPGDFTPVRVVDPATGLNESKKDTVPASRQPNAGKPEPVYVPPVVTTSPNIHKGDAGYTPPQPQVKQTKGEAVTQTEEAAVIAREHSPGKPYWRPRKSPSANEVKVAVAMLPKWKDGVIVFAGPRSFAGRRMFKHTKHGTKKAVEVWEPAPPFV